jgi:hypothetical protein
MALGSARFWLDSETNYKLIFLNRIY